MRTRIVKWGNSLGLRIPKAFAHEVQITDGTVVDLSLTKGELVIRVVPESGLSLAELLADVSTENIHGEISTGDAVGGEQW